eukprot:TRINITY_DN2184_c0_g1_i1.p1 TRINITY_DN2184_c0_g1~~TRINITY_DN2184_c0_g1_i1.p1  ORF type:complete len:508 (-),score=67.81 TRINITY_DN2184_c0_g1_i1:676-2013(-)
MSVPSGTPLLLEHLPYISHRSESTSSGALLIVYGSGEVGVIPLNDTTRAIRPFTTGLLLTEPDEDSSPEARFFLYDVQIPENEFIWVHQLQFLPREDTSGLHPPSILRLSPDKRYLMVSSVLHAGQESIVVYRIMQHASGYIQLVLAYSDLSMSFIDVCFSPDSRAIAAVPRRYPTLIFLLSLPLAASTREQELVQSAQLMAEQERVSHFARPVGPLTVLGPARGVFDRPLEIRRIECNECHMGEQSFDFITWGGDTMAEYCLWKVARLEAQSASGAFEHQCCYYPRLIGNVTDEAWLMNENNPKSTILEAKLQDDEVLFITKRSKFDSEGGIGMQGGIARYGEKVDISASYVWYLIAGENSAEPVHPSQVHAKWMHPLLLGNCPSSCLLLENIGVFEFVDQGFGSAFQQKNQDFCKGVRALTQVGEYTRFWAHKNGSVHVMSVQ